MINIHDSNQIKKHLTQSKKIFHQPISRKYTTPTKHAVTLRYIRGIPLQ